MELDKAFDVVPDDEDLLYSTEHWDQTDILDDDGHHSDNEVEAFVHPRTATAARIMKDSDGTLSVQPTMGGYSTGDCVVQSNDPTTLVSGGSSVVMMELLTLAEARVVAYVWLRGWVQRNTHIGENEGDVQDAERNGEYDPIE